MQSPNIVGKGRCRVARLAVLQFFRAVFKFKSAGALAAYFVFFLLKVHQVE
jgi:hypothetical protein